MIKTTIKQKKASKKTKEKEKKEVGWNEKGKKREQQRFIDRNGNQIAT